MRRLVAWMVAADRQGIELARVVDWMNDGTLSMFEVDGETVVDELELIRVAAEAGTASGQPTLHRPQLIEPGTVRVAQRGQLVSLTAGVLPEERDRIIEAAAARGMSTASWARHVLVAAATDLTESD